MEENRDELGLLLPFTVEVIQGKNVKRKDDELRIGLAILESIEYLSKQIYELHQSQA